MLRWNPRIEDSCPPWTNVVKLFPRGPGWPTRIGKETWKALCSCETHGQTLERSESIVKFRGHGDLTMANLLPQALIAQLGRASDWRSEGHWFNPGWGQIFFSLQVFFSTWFLFFRSGDEHKSYKERQLYSSLFPFKCEDSTVTFIFSETSGKLKWRTQRTGVNFLYSTLRVWGRGCTHIRNNIPAETKLGQTRSWKSPVKKEITKEWLLQGIGMRKDSGAKKIQHAANLRPDIPRMNQILFPSGKSPYNLVRSFNL